MARHTVAGSTRWKGVWTGAALMALPTLTAGCDDTVFGSEGGEAVDGEGWDAVQTVFQQNCYSCHGTGVGLGDLDLESDACADLVDVPAANPAYGGAVLVSPGDVAGSVLWAKCADTGEYGGVMPTSAAMDQANIDIIAGWIDAGASCDSTGGGDDGGDDSGSTGGDDTGEPETWQGDYSFANVQSEIFDATCTSGCHEDGGVYATLDLTSSAYAAIYEQASSAGPNYIEPSDPSSSYIYLKMTNDESISGSVMPYSGQLSAQYVDLMSGWISAGAPE